MHVAASNPRACRVSQTAVIVGYGYGPHICLTPLPSERDLGGSHESVSFADSYRKDIEATRGLHISPQTNTNDVCRSIYTPTEETGITLAASATRPGKS